MRFYDSILLRGGLSVYNHEICVSKRIQYTNCILINLKKDIARFNSAKEELKKLSVELGTFTHFDATNGKNQNELEKDLNICIEFLKNFDKKIKVDKRIWNKQLIK